MPLQRILHLSDIHIGLEGENTYGIDVRAHFLSCLQEGIERGAKLIVISGDIAFRTGNPEIYKWVHQQLKRSTLPCFILAGNHDNPKDLSSCFEQQAWYRKEQGEMYSSIELQGRKIIFLDSSKGDISTTQFNWLNQQLTAINPAPLVFLHHPPTKLHMNYMENPYQGPHPRLLDLLERKSPNAHIFVGHYHINSVLCRPKSTIYVCPATYFQIDPNEQSFRIESQQPGYSIIQFDQKIVMRTTHYLPSQLL